ncbi:replication initiation protein [Thioalkalivibrio sp. ALE19]|uniref:replication initiation protein n=1 Tax=Thioalkalivibrio sp. ALE19 TaxID=1266909 RepID=UPI000685D95F|nr:replication initiation protein [Thioalkalivibrio sp. ALE19]
MSVDEADPQKPILYKHTGVIHVSADLTGMARRTYNALLLHAQPRLREVLTHEIHLSELAQKLSYASRNRQHLIDTLYLLRDTKARFNVLGKAKDDSWVQMTGSLLAEIGISDRSVCHYSFGPNMAELLANPSIYARLDLAVQNRLTLKHAIILHEYYLDELTTYRSQREIEVPIEVYRELLCLGETHKKFKQLKAKVLKPAHEDLRSNGDIIATEVEQIRRSRAVKSLRVRIERKKRGEKGELPTGGVQAIPAQAIDQADGLITALVERGVHEVAARKLVEDYSSAQVQGNIEYADAAAARGEIGGAGYYVSAIREDYARVSSRRSQGRAPVQQDAEDDVRRKAEDYMRRMSRKEKLAVMEQSGIFKSSEVPENPDVQMRLQMYLEREQPWLRGTR